MIPDKFIDHNILSPKLLALPYKPTPKKVVVDIISIANKSETIEIHLDVV